MGLLVFFLYQMKFLHHIYLYNIEIIVMLSSFFLQAKNNLKYLSKVGMF